MEDDDEAIGQISHPGFFTVAVVLHDKQLGGIEEGGWFYDTFEVTTDPDMPTPRIFSDREEANLFAEQMDRELKAHNEGRPDISSVLSIGRYESYVFDGFPMDLPERRPRYE